MANTAELDSNVSASTNVRDARGFYNSTQDRGLDHRGESKIFYMRNFNNWTKSTLIDSYLQRIRTEQPDRSNEIHVFDMGCGKGGDIPKWLVGRVKFVAFGDIAENSVEDCRRRHRERNCKFGAEFFAIDCTKELVRDKLKTSEPCFDLVSTQFVIHYSFDKYASANRFLRNAAEFLRIGGYFIGTTVNSCDLVERCRNAPDQCISNDVFSIRFDSSIDLSKTSDESIPLFGAKYHFTLDELVDCPEYLVYFPLLEQLAKEHGLERVERETFHDYFNKNKDSIQSRFLQKKMTALEYYELPKDDQGGQQSLRLDPSQYAHAEKYLTEEIEENPNSARCCRTLSKQEWEITSLYIIFAFKKVREVKYDGDADTNN